MALSPSNMRGAAYALTAFAVFATHDVVVKSLGASYGAVQIMFFSVLFGFPLLTLMLMQDPTRGNLRPVHPWWMALRTVAVVITGLCAFYAFSHLPLAQAYAIFFASPLLITLLSIPILGEKVGVHRGAAVVAGLDCFAPWRRSFDPWACGGGCGCGLQRCELGYHAQDRPR